MSKIERRLQRKKAGKQNQVSKVVAVDSPVTDLLELNLDFSPSPPHLISSKEKKTSPKKKKTVTFQIDEQELLALTELAKKQDRSISSCIRMLIKSAIANEGRNRYS